jgi:hypothetical protein
MSSIVLNDEQQQAYNAIGAYKSLFISGAAGCGKSVVITEKIKNDSSGKFILCATTNKAASVLAEKLATGDKVLTLYSVLGLKPVHDGSTKESDEITNFPLTIDPLLIFHLRGKSLIIDEASMISQELENYLLEIQACGNLDTITFVGDRYQLPCVKGEFFDYSAIEKVIELHAVQRAKGDLLDYYTKVREAVKSDEEIPLFGNAPYFTDFNEFMEYMKSCQGSKLIVTYTNEAAQRHSTLIDGTCLYIGQECNALSQCSYNHVELTKKRDVKTNSSVRILKVFSNHEQMERDAMREDYEYYLPKKPQDMEIDVIQYVKLLNEYNEIVYVSVWIGTQDEKSSLYLNRMNREYRNFQDDVRKSIPSFLWAKFAKEDGYMKDLFQLSRSTRLPSHILVIERKFWHNFHAIMDAIILRSSLVSTAHRAQGMTVDVVGIDLDNLQRSGDRKLCYVALTRASKEIVYFSEGGIK